MDISMELAKVILMVMMTSFGGTGDSGSGTAISQVPFNNMAACEKAKVQLNRKEYIEHEPYGRTILIIVDAECISID